LADWEDFAAFVASLSTEERERVGVYAAVEIPEDTDAIAEVLRDYAAAHPETTPATLLATTGSQAGYARDLDLSRRMGRAALGLAGTPEEKQLAHVCLAQAHFQNRREEADLEAFVEHCRAAIELGHAGTFCYERLAVLYEYRGDVEEAVAVCRRAVEILGAAGDERSAERFRAKLERLAGKRDG
jgi:TPR repeat protein